MFTFSVGKGGDEKKTRRVRVKVPNIIKYHASDFLSHSEKEYYVKEEHLSDVLEMFTYTTFLVERCGLSVFRVI